MITFHCPLCSKDNEDPEMEIIGKNIRFYCSFCSKFTEYLKISEKNQITELTINNMPENVFADFPDLQTEWNTIRILPPESPQHDSFLEKCFKNNALTDATIAYKSLYVNEGIDTSRRIRQLTILAQMSILNSSEENKKKKTNWLYIFFMVTIASFFLWILLTRF